MNPALHRLVALAAAPARRILGLMSGTSLDGLDLALCHCQGAGSTLQLRLEHHATAPYPPALQARLRAISQPQVSLEALTVLHAELARHHAAAVLETLQTWGIDPAEIDLLASHGQTVWHSPAHQRPGPAYPHHATLQIGDADHLAALTGILTVADFRQKHVAHGHEGAPLAGYADALLFGHPTQARVLLNLGGIANFTYLPAGGGPSLVTDTGPANTLLDAAVRQHLPGQAFDAEGRLAAQGTPHPALVAALLAHPFFAAPLPKTTGPELFSPAYLATAQQATGTAALPLPHLLATLVELTATSIAQALNTLPQRPETQVFVSGGGAHNPVLLAAIQRRLPGFPLDPTEALGIPADAKEAVLFAVLATETLAGNPALSLGKISLP